MDSLRQWAAATPDKPAVQVADTSAALSYRALDESADRIASLFQSLSLGEGSAIALLIANEPRMIELWWGARRAGLYYVPLSGRLHPNELSHVVADSGARLLIASAGLADLAKQVTVQRLLVLGSEFDRLLEGAASLPLAASAVTGRELIYSSGTTGKPKGVRRELARVGDDNPLSDLEKRIRALFGFDADTTYLSVSPLYHATGRFLMRVIECGGTTVVLPKFEPEHALAAIERHGITHSQWVPTMFARLLALSQEERANYDLSTHRVALHAAAPCPPHVKRAMINWWGPIVQEYYGGTENAGVTFIGAEEWLAHPGSVGRPIAGSVHILADDGSERELPAGEVGLIYFEGGVPFTYLHEQTPSASSQGYTTYGDLGHVDAEGYLYISDRRSDLIISGGVNIYPKEVEQILDSHPAVRESAVIGLPDSEYGQRVHAVVCSVAPEDGLSDVLLAYCRDRLSGFKCPRGISFVDDLPRNENGKLLKRVLREQFSGAQPA